jgi:hypothetical protein
MPPEPEVLYHYTSPAGFLGIIDSKTIWATGAEHLNDSQEVLHAIKIAQGLLPEFESEHPAVPVVRDLLENRLEEGLRRIYVASWAEDGDQLSQWRGYGGGGAAYSLGFSRQALHEEAHAAEWRRLGRCVYDGDEQEKYLHTSLSNLISQAVKLEYAEPWRSQYDPANPESAESFAWQLYSSLLQSAALMKHSGFSEEKEWRLVTSLFAAQPVKHRAQPHAIVPYMAFALPERDGKLDIRQTIIGPTAEQSRAYAAVHSLYVTSSLLEPNSSQLRGEVRHSKIPYRYW